MAQQVNFSSGGADFYMYKYSKPQNINIFNKLKIKENIFFYNIDHAQTCETETTNDGKLGLILNNEYEKKK